MFKNPHSLLHDAEAQKLCNHLDDYLEPEFASASDFYQNPLTNYLDTLWAQPAVWLRAERTAAIICAQ